MHRISFSVFFVILGFSSVASFNKIIFKPCGNNLGGFLSFEKFNEGNLWRTVLNLGFYNNLVQPTNVRIKFVGKIGIVAIYNTVRLSGINQFRIGDEILIECLQGITTYYIDINICQNFQYPHVESVIVNGYMICNNNAQYIQPSQVTTVPPNVSQNTSNPGCGRRQSKYINLMVDSTEAEPGQWPWHVAIYKLNKNYENGKYRCGGSLISRNAVITVAHCTLRHYKIIEPRRLEVHAGTVDLSEDDCEGCQNTVGKQIIKHPYHTSTKNHADIAILILYSSLYLTEFVQTICLSAPYPEKYKLDGTYGTVAGFGMTKENVLSDDLLYAKVQIQLDSTCYASDPLFYGTLLNNSTFCAGNGPDSDVGPCNGDSGGGLVIPEKQSDGSVVWFLRGLVSMAKRKPGATDVANTKYYTVYTDVGAYNSWIVEALRVTGE